eukprot:CAMPEP_0173149724 /NCGR_PEP_ID=MMETSP1105-20130129/10504_1 /TAXON_ID=2985 /ORGANISM="Ochromonas sp., Strain BG-1" /LENGTH=221 /DNA_ID=CAMNT_0014064661 /DNA_START=138 /DNA_END=803 /DNA_ORIENTATION=+
MTRLRDKKTSTGDFRRILKEVTFYLGYEATRDLKVASEVVSTPMDLEFTGSKLGEKVAIIPILRAGLGMSEGMLELIPQASVHHIGMYRSKDSLLPIQYYNRLPKNAQCDVAYVVDPCIATANTLHAVVQILKRWGAKRIVVIAAIGARAGVNRLAELHPSIDIFIGAIDDTLSEAGMILPGIGDAGDRQFGTHHDEVPNLLPNLPETPVGEKRKRVEEEK